MANLTESQMLERATQSPALKWQSDVGGRSNYPANFRGRVPLKVKVATTVLPDSLPSFAVDPNVKCEKDQEYFVWVNSYGAVSAILPNGKELGLLPSEFDVVQWHETVNQPTGANSQQ